MADRTLIPGFITISELAHILRARGLVIPTNTIRYWIYQRRISAHQFGKRGLWLLPAIVLDNAIADRDQVKDALGYRRL